MADPILVAEGVEILYRCSTTPEVEAIVFGNDGRLMHTGKGNYLFQMNECVVCGEKHLLLIQGEL